MKTDYWLSYPADYKKQLKPLLHQQMWLFGQDVLYPQGNLLYGYQFTHKRPEGRGGPMYTRQDGSQQIALWGWGLWLGQTEKGAVFVNRYTAKPQFTPVATLTQAVFTEAELPDRTCRMSNMADVWIIQELWVTLLSWLAEYEAWILTTAGEKWRQASVKSFKHAITKPQFVSTLASQWKTLAEQSTALPIKSNTR